jgi:hypothetical protein
MVCSNGQRKTGETGASYPAGRICRVARKEALRRAKRHAANASSSTTFTGLAGLALVSPQLRAPWSSQALSE